MNEKDLDLIKKASSEIDKIKFSDGTEYFRMPNGNLVRSTPRPFKIRKNK
jgi:hypothetical protein